MKQRKYSFLKLNIFKINLEKLSIPEKIYVYNVSANILDSSKLTSFYKRLENTYGFMDIQNHKLYSYREIDFIPKNIRENLNLKLEKTIELSELESSLRNQILKPYIRNSARIDIKRIIKEIQDQFLSEEKKKIGRWTLSIILERINVEHINDAFYVAFNVKLRILANKNLWDFIGRDLKKLKTLCWSPDKSKDIKIWFRYVPDLKEENERSYLLTYIQSKDKSRNSGFSFENLRYYPQEKRNVTYEELKEIAKFEDFDENQPIIVGVPSIDMRNPLYFLPQYCIPAYNPVLASKNEIQEIQNVYENALFRNKHKIIYEICDKIPYLELDYEDISFKELDNQREGKLKVNVVKAKLYLSKNKQGREIIECQVIRKLQGKTIENTADLFRWIHKLNDLREKKIRELIVDIPIPEYVPEYLKKLNEVGAFLLVESGNPSSDIDTIKNFLHLIADVYRIVREASSEFNRIPKLKFTKNPEANKVEFLFKNSLEEIDRITRELGQLLRREKKELGFAFIFGSLGDFIEESEDFDYYIPLKRNLFLNNIISQNFLIDTYTSKDKIKFALSNIVYNLFGKLGIKFFALEEKVYYDYILGIDTGLAEAYTGRVAGCTTIHDSEGRLKNIIPIEKLNPARKETARIKALLEEIHIDADYDVDFSNKKILILRDGIIQPEELSQLVEFAKSKKCKITMIDVRKQTVYQWLEKGNNKHLSVKVGSFWLLKPHNPKRGYPRMIKITQKVEIDENGFVYKDLTDYDISLIYKLTLLNYSTIGRPSNLKLPGPIYYADKLVKALKRGWKLEPRLLKEGLLYFL